MRQVIRHTIRNLLFVLLGVFLVWCVLIVSTYREMHRTADVVYQAHQELSAVQSAENEDFVHGWQMQCSQAAGRHAQACDQLDRLLGPITLDLFSNESAYAGSSDRRAERGASLGGQ